MHYFNVRAIVSHLLPSGSLSISFDGLVGWSDYERGGLGSRVVSRGRFYGLVPTVAALTGLGASDRRRNPHAPLVGARACNGVAMPFNKVVSYYMVRCQRTLLLCFSWLAEVAWGRIRVASVVRGSHSWPTVEAWNDVAMRCHQRL
jgi:hypothetical protein